MGLSVWLLGELDNKRHQRGILDITTTIIMELFEKFNLHALGIVGERALHITMQPVTIIIRGRCVYLS